MQKKSSFQNHQLLVKVSSSIFGIGLLILGGFFLVSKISLESPQNTTKYRSEIIDISSKRSEVEQSISNLGGAEAYQKLKQEVSSKSLAYQHDAAHIFGEMLYRAEGLDGLIVCDNDLLNGCFHGFLLSAIGRQGLDVIAQVNNYCDANLDIMNLACQHGVGHGLGEYFGAEKLNDQLETCLELSWKKPIGGCIGGVIMEYHFPSLLDDQAEIIGIRSYDPDKPYNPCDKIDERFVASCAYYIPRWWQNFVSYQQIGELCQGFTTQQQWYCFHGAGYIAAHRTTFDVEETKQLCNQMPTQDSRLWCRLSAAWSFHTSPNEKDRVHWQEVCQDLDGQEAYCLEEHDFDLVIPRLPDLK